MSHLYVHIPFCASRCIYCDFFSTTQHGRMDDYTAALCREIRERCAGETFSTIYFGGGTPSWLGTERLGRIIDTISDTAGAIDANAEITLECNPDDVTDGFVTDVRRLPFNRVSLGVQSLTDERLRLIGRRHDAQQAIDAVARLQDAGYRNISIDMIYGLPGQTLGEWRRDLATALRLGTQHLSAYSLMYEERTVLWQLREQHRVAEAHEELSVAMYNHLVDSCEAAGLRQYELSNFALAGFESRHNSAYWQGKTYIGVGAGAHSFDGQGTRSNNIGDLDRYINGREYETERLSDDERFNELVFTQLRTRDGIDLAQLAALHPTQSAAITKVAERHVSLGNLVCENGRLRLTRQALFISDDVMSDLMIV